MDGGRIAQAALAFGGIAPLPWRDPAVEAALAGETPSPAVFDRAADVLLAEAQGHGGNDFKIPLLRRTLAAVLREAAGQGEEA
jgi:xanthine dehydrogenase YagS FAD-binding subunit